MTASNILSPERAHGRINISRVALESLCRRYHIKSLALFGSVLRDDFRADSDIDILAEFEPGQTPGFLKMADIEAELTALLGNRKIDLRTPQDLSHHFRDRVIKEAEVLCR